MKRLIRYLELRDFVRFLGGIRPSSQYTKRQFLHNLGGGLAMQPEPRQRITCRIFNNSYEICSKYLQPFWEEIGPVQ